MAKPIAVHVNCPLDIGNIEELAANHQAALNLFRDQCPPGARVVSVQGIRGKRKEKCAWRVQYARVIAPEFLNISPEEFVLQISNFQPNNTTIIKTSRIPYSPTIEMVYSVRCLCEVSPNAGMTIKRSASVETINADFVTLKVEENI